MLMDSASYLRCFRRELDAFRSCVATGDLSTPIEHQDDPDHPVDLAGLAAAVGGANLFAAACVTEWKGTEHPPDGAPPKAPQERDELVRWLDGTGEVLTMGLDTDPGTPAWGFYTPPNAAYWQRSIAVATMLSRWDAQLALGEPDALDPQLAGAGITEVFEVLAPRQIGRGKAWPPDDCIRLDASDTGDWWIFGPGDPVAEIHAPAADLLLLLRGRKTPDDPAFTWIGDRPAALAVLKGPLI
jgi:uncharacterized protein (TIGR03083 family)